MEDDVTRWLHDLADGDEDAVQEIWNRYFTRLVNHARRKLIPGRLRDTDEEDIALSAFHSFYRGATAGRFPRLDDRHDLWKLLLVITARKASKKIRGATRAKRGGGKVRGESVFATGAEDQGNIDAAMGTEPTPEFAVAAVEEYQILLDQLPDNSFRQIAGMKIEGYTNEEIADQLECSPRTVERKLNKIREAWSPS